VKDDRLERLRAEVSGASTTEQARRDVALQALIYAEELRETFQRERQRSDELHAANRSLERAAERMRQLEAVKEEFIANCSHELRTPLTPIIGWADVLSRKERPTEEVQKFADTIATQGRRLLAVVDSLIKVAAIQRDYKRRGEAEEVDLQGLLGEFEMTIVSKGRPVEVSVDPEVARIKSEGDYLREVLGYLVDNALKFSPEESPIALRATSGEGEVVVEVVDRGPGLPNDQDAIFGAFRQGDASSTRAHGGLGLGLYLSKHLVEAHSGHIWAEDTPGGGAKVGFSIPQRRNTDGA
jgi:signal transduction histidine kinase